MPAVRILDNVQLEANTYIIKIKEVDAGTGRIWPNQFMVMDPAGNQVARARHPHHRADLRAAGDLGRRQPEGRSLAEGLYRGRRRDRASTHLTELLKNNMSDLLSYGEVQKLLKDLPKEQGELVKDIVPSLVTISGIQRVLQLLLAERISIRDLSTILEGIADALAFSRNPATMVEHVRARLARQICAQNTSANGYLPLIALSAKWEQAFAESLIGTGRGTQPGDAAVETVGVHDRGARPLRAGRARGRGAGAGDLGGDPAVRALAGGALPVADHRAVAGRNPSAGAAEDGRQRLARRSRRPAKQPSERLFRHRQMIFRLGMLLQPFRDRAPNISITYCNI